jgi:hypothetical protein
MVLRIVSFYTITFKLVFINIQVTSTKPMGNKMPGNGVAKSALSQADIITIEYRILL